MRVLLVTYDNGSFVDCFPLGNAYIASSLIEENHTVDIYSQDIYHYSDEHLKEYLNKNDKYDVIGIGIIAGYYQYRKLLSLSKQINESHNRPKYFILGGHGPDPEPEYFLRKTGADIVVHSEGEKTICDLLKAIEYKVELEFVHGISFLKNDKCFKTKRRELIKDIDLIPFPAWEKFNIDRYCLVRQPGIDKTDRTMSMLSARGCPYKCNFCFRSQKGYRMRSVDSIIEEIKLLQEEFKINSIEFLDELLMFSVDRTQEICERFLEENLNIKWVCNGRLNIACKSKDLMKLMKKSGCVFINYGIESLNDEVLKRMNKNLTVKQIEEGVSNTHFASIYPGLNIIFGNYGDTKEILERGVDFIKKYGGTYQMRTIRPVTPYPGSPLYYDAINQGLIEDVKDFYENKHINSDLLTVNFTNMKDEDFYKALKSANLELTNDYYEKCKNSMMCQIHNLYEKLDSSFRGFRQM